MILNTSSEKTCPWLVPDIRGENIRILIINYGVSCNFLHRAFFIKFRKFPIFLIG